MGMETSLFDEAADKKNKHHFTPTPNIGPWKNKGNHPQPTPVREEPDAFSAMNHPQIRGADGPVPPGNRRNKDKPGIRNAENAENSRRPEGRFQHRGIRRQAQTFQKGPDGGGLRDLKL